MRFYFSLLFNIKLKMHFHLLFFNIQHSVLLTLCLIASSKLAGKLCIIQVVLRHFSEHGTFHHCNIGTTKDIFYDKLVVWLQINLCLYNYWVGLLVSHILSLVPGHSQILSCSCGFSPIWEWPGDEATTFYFLNIHTI